MAVAIIQEAYFHSSQCESALALQEAFRAANRAIYRTAQSDHRYTGMATTCTALVLKGRTGLVAHVGDSRVYLFQYGKLQQITQDHTFISSLVDQGLLSPEEAQNHPQKHVLTKALGHLSEVHPDIHYIQDVENEGFILCSDGLYNLVPAKDIATVLREHSAQESGKILIQLARERGGFDNITILVLNLDRDNKCTPINLNKTIPFSESKIPQNSLDKLLRPLIVLLILVIVLYHIFL